MLHSVVCDLGLALFTRACRYEYGTYGNTVSVSTLETAITDG